jgi:hypothetical protein
MIPLETALGGLTAGKFERDRELVASMLKMRTLLCATVRTPMDLAALNPKMAATASKLTNGRFKGWAFEPVGCRRPTGVTLLTQG